MDELKTSGAKFNHKARTPRRLTALLSFIALLFACHPAFAVISNIQGNWNMVWGSSNTVSVAVSSAQTAGNLNVIIVGWRSATIGISSVTDARGNTYSLAAGPTIATGAATQAIYYAKNIVSATANQNSITVTFSGSVDLPDIRFYEYSGVATVNPLDAAVAASGVGTSIQSGSMTTTNASDLFVAGAFIERQWATTDSNFNHRMQTSMQSTYSDRTVSSTGSYSISGTQTSSGYWIMSMASFKEAGAADTTAPTVPTNVAATAASSSQINLSWTASTDNSGVAPTYEVIWCSGASCTPGGTPIAVTGTSYNHTGLTASTIYRYQVRAKDGSNNVSAYTSVVSATTQTGSDTTPPSVPTNFAGSAPSSSQVNLTWTASTDNSGVAPTYEIIWCFGSGCTPSGTPIAASGTSFNHTDRNSSTTYRYQIRAKDGSSNVSAYTSVVTVTTLAASDTTPPSVPTGFTATSASSSQINLSWTASTDNSGVAPTYEFIWCSGASCTPSGTPVAVTGTTYSHTGLTASTTYRYQVRAKDGSNNLSAYTAIASATTQTPADTTAPTVPTGFIATVTASAQISLSWTASTDNSGVAPTYEFISCSGAGCTPSGTPVGVTGTSYTHTGLIAFTIYRYQVRAKDGSNNVSAYTPIQSATTTSALLPPATVNVTARSDKEIDIAWSASTSTGVTGYIVERCQGVSCSSFAQVGSSTTDLFLYDAGKTQNTSYSYRVRTLINSSQSAASTVLTVVTLQTPACN